MSAPRRARGPYSPLICTRCRARKIKCVLPASVIGSSTTAQAPDLACRRCKDNGFDCIVNQTVLGRPGASLRTSKGIRMGTSQDDFVEGACAPTTTTGEFLLSQPYDEAVTGDKIGAAEIAEAMSTPLRFLSVLLSRHPAFGVHLSGRELWKGPVSLHGLLSSVTQELLESRLAWHRVYNPYIPTLHTLSSRLQYTPHGSSTVALYALLCLLAVETSSTSSALPDTDVRTLRFALYHYGQTTLMRPPAHRDTVTLFQLLAEYRPLSLVDSPVAATASLTDSSYLSLARTAAIDIGLDQSWMIIDAENSEVGGAVLETLQWLHLSMTYGYSSFVMGKTDMRQDPLNHFHPLVHKLESLVVRQAIPPHALYLTVHLLCAAKSVRARHQMILFWRDLDALRGIVQRHNMESTEFRTSLVASMQSSNMQEASVIGALLDADDHKHNLLVRQSAMFFAVMAASHFREEATFDPVEITQLGDKVIDQLKIPSQVNQVHAFMTELGANTADELEKQLTDFISLCEDCRLNGIAYSPPTKTVASEVLHTAYLLVQQNAARLKGWGGLHERVDTHIIVLRECANRLDSLASHEGEIGLVNGGILKSTADLVRDLQGIISQWKRRISQIPHPNALNRPATSRSCTESTDVLGDQPTTTVDLSTTNSPGPSQVPGAWATDMFTTWDMWPQPESVDFSQFIDFDYDPAGQDEMQ